jgi:spore coat polysaccharide biosynthesis protein SpsF
MLERLRRCEKLDGIVVACPNTEGNWPIVEVAQNTGAGVFLGSEKDVLSRVLGAAETFGVDLIVELTADCPLIDPQIVDNVVNQFLGDGNQDFVANTIEVHDALGYRGEPTYPRGMDVRVFPTGALKWVDGWTQDPADREHVSLFFWENPERLILQWVPAPPELADDVRLTVDTPEDLALVRAVFDYFAPRNDFALAEILALLNERPALRELNAYVLQKTVR